MCQVAWRTDTETEIGSMGDLRALVGAERIVAATYGDEDKAENERFVAGLSDADCLCHVRLRETLEAAGLVVWDDPEWGLPELYCRAAGAAGAA